MPRKWVPKRRARKGEAQAKKTYLNPVTGQSLDRKTGRFQPKASKQTPVLTDGEIPAVVASSTDFQALLAKGARLDQYASKIHANARKGDPAAIAQILQALQAVQHRQQSEDTSDRLDCAVYTDRELEILSALLRKGRHEPPLTRDAEWLASLAAPAPVPMIEPDEDEDEEDDDEEEEEDDDDEGDDDDESDDDDDLAAVQKRMPLMFTHGGRIVEPTKEQVQEFKTREEQEAEEDSWPRRVRRGPKPPALPETDGERLQRSIDGTRCRSLSSWIDPDDNPGI